MSNQRYGSNKTLLIGDGIDADLTKLDPGLYEGAVVYSGEQLYFSNGSAWVIPQDDVDVSRPAALQPTNATEQTQLRLSAFRSPGGFLQEGIIFEVNDEPSFATPLFTRTVTSAISNLYQILYPDDGFQPGDVIWWRAKYLGSGGTQSQFSLPFAQTFPDLIVAPTPVTRVNQIVSQVEISPYDSPAIFNLSYFETETEFYTADGLTLLTTVTQSDGAITIVPEIASMPEGASYVFRSRYGARVSVGSPVIYSEFSAQRQFFNGGGAMLLEYNLDEALSRTVNLPLGVYDATGLNVTVNWGDGLSDTYTTGGIKSHVYAAGVGPIINVSISGTMRQYGGNTNQDGLKRVDNWGFRLGLTSLREALRNTKTLLEYASPNIPGTVTSLQGFLINALPQAGVVDVLDTSGVTNMTELFYLCPYSGDISNWDVSSVTTMAGMFRGDDTVAETRNFQNSTIASWNVSSVTDMSFLAERNRNFNVDITGWDVSNVTTFANAFAAYGDSNNRLAMTFNQNISSWDVSNAVNMASMFFSSRFNQPIGNWNVSKVTNMRGMFGNWRIGNTFNQDIGAWDVSSVTDMAFMFGYGGSAFGGFNSFNNGGSDSIKNWNTSSVTTMYSMFRSNTAFNQPIGSWNVSSVTNMQQMFHLSDFDQDIGAWDVSNLVTMSPTSNWQKGMFEGSPFNNGGSTSISNWNLASATNLSGLFHGASAFNQPIGNWDTSNVEYFGSKVLNSTYGMLWGTNAFSQDISSWDLSPTIQTADRFLGPGMSVGLYSKLLVGWANQVGINTTPIGWVVGMTGLTYDNRDFSADFPGARFTDAVAARAFLVGALSVVVSSASTGTADGTYLYNAASLTYDNSVSGWYFVRVGNRWELRDDTDAVQDSSSGNQEYPWLETGWTTVLATATLLSGGAAWTISGDSAA